MLTNLRTSITNGNLSASPVVSKCLYKLPLKKMATVAREALSITRSNAQIIEEVRILRGVSLEHQSISTMFFLYMPKEIIERTLECTTRFYSILLWTTDRLSPYKTDLPIGIHVYLNVFRRSMICSAAIRATFSVQKYQSQLYFVSWKTNRLGYG
jgi:hypothetical protein